MESIEIMVVAITSVLVSFGFPVLIVAIVLYYKLQRDRIVHDTIAKLAEKGLPIPPELLARPHRPTGNRDLRSGLILIGLGIGLVIFFTEVAPAARAIGLIPGLIGVAFLISWAIERKLRRERDPNDR
jgi:hypothetical protein